jgi:hypothetical protein
MNVNSISNNIELYMQSLLSSAASTNNTSTSASTTAASPASPQDGNPQLSPFAQVLSALQQLQQSNPTEYQQVTSQIATNLQTAASTATADGNTTQAAQLNRLATDFTSASQNGTLPNIQDLAQAMSSGHHHHHHMQASSGSSDQSSSASELSNQISAFLVNATSSTQAASLDPLSIIQNTLSSAGVSLS